MSEKKDQHVSLNLPPSEREALEAWMARRRVFSKSAAIRCMIRAGVANDIEPDEEPDQRRERSVRRKEQNR